MAKDVPRDTARCANQDCRCEDARPTTKYAIARTGVVERLYVCNRCGWGTWIRYHPTQPALYIQVRDVSAWNTSLTPFQRALGMEPPSQAKNKKAWYHSLMCKPDPDTR